MEKGKRAIETPFDRAQEVSSGNKKIQKENQRQTFGQLLRRLLFKVCICIKILLLTILLHNKAKTNEESQPAIILVN